MVVLPKHYRRLRWIDSTRYRVDISLYPFNGAIEVPLMYVSAWEATCDRENGNKLSSVVNTTTRYRGCGNQSAWDGTYRDACGKPATAISLTNYRNYARLRGQGWNCYEYVAHLSIYWLYTIEYANLNSQATYNASKTADGYAQGGLGAGVTNINSTKWNTYNSYYPFIPCGYTLSLGNKSGVVAFAFDETQIEAYGAAYTANVPSYRGIENPFGHIFKWADGIAFYVQTDDDGGSSKAYRCDNQSNYGDTSKYVAICDIPRTSSYIKSICGGSNADIIPVELQSSSAYYFADYFFTNIASTSWRGLVLGGHANYGTHAGLACSLSYNGFSTTYAHYGSRLCFHPNT